jgi:hypothetical protein
VADYLSREVVDPVFAVPEAYAAPDVALSANALDELGVDMLDLFAASAAGHA